MTTTNGTTDEDVAKRVVFATDDEPPDLPAELARPPKPREPRFDYLVATSKELGIVANDASLDSEAKQRISLEILDRAEKDSLFGGSRLGRAIQDADRLWRSVNPEISAELGNLGARSHDLSGRPTRGPARAVALLLETLSEDHTTTLSPAEAELLRSLCPEVAEALEQREQSIAEHGGTVLAAVLGAQTTYPAGTPGPAIQREGKVT